jgi:hypothetical protein
MTKTFLVALILLFSGVVVAQMPIAELPRTYIDSTWNSPAGGTTWAAHTSMQLTNVLKSVAPGDIIVLDVGLHIRGISGSRQDQPE